MSIKFPFFDKKQLPEATEVLEGRAEEIQITAEHYINGHAMKAPFPSHLQQIILGFGCFWGAERKMWQQEGVWSTAVGYSAGHTANATYKEVCSGRTGHNEVVLVVFDPAIISFNTLLNVFWEAHDPTQGMRQGNDRGTQYRSGIYTFDEEQQQQAEASKARYQQALKENGIVDNITTEIIAACPFYYAEEYHQQYLAKNPEGYCGLNGTGVSCPI